MVFPEGKRLDQSKDLYTVALMLPRDYQASTPASACKLGFASFACCYVQACIDCVDPANNNSSLGLNTAFKLT